jgi:GT2 family glycosyltransferase
MSPVDDSVAIVVLTHNRLHLLRQCVENVLLRTSAATREILVWDNGSTDGTAAYLQALEDPRVRVVAHPRNIGQNAYAEAFRLISSEYMVELDDDVVDAPADWDRMLLDGFRGLPDIGFLAADLEDDEHDTAAHVRYRVRPHLYRPVERNGVRLLVGPTGGGCAMTSRSLYELVGGFRQQKGQVFWLEDAAYIADLRERGYEAAILRDLKVRHAGGPYYAEQTPDKAAYWAREERIEARKRFVKRLLLLVPLVGRLNRRYGWFVEPTQAA